MEGGRLVCPHGREEREEIRDPDGGNVNFGLCSGAFQVLPVEDQFSRVGIAPEPDIPGKARDLLLVTLNGPG